MPIISITKEMLDRGMVPDKGWSTAKLNEAKENKAKSGNSINYFFDFELTGGPENKPDNKGRYQNFMLNSAGLDKGLGIEDFKRMIAALSDRKPSEIGPDDFDTDKLIGKECWIKIDIETVEGKLTTKISDFSRIADVPF